MAKLRRCNGGVNGLIVCACNVRVWKACRNRHSHRETPESQHYSLETISIRCNPFARPGWSSSALLQFEMGLSAVAASSFILRLQVPASIGNIQGRERGRVAQSINPLRKQPRQGSWPSRRDCLDLPCETKACKGSTSRKGLADACARATGAQPRDSRRKQNCIRSIEKRELMRIFQMDERGREGVSLR
jgi:hypothetical protein